MTITLQDCFYDDAGSPISGAEVTLQTAVQTGEGTTQSTTTTNADGLWSFAGLTAGAYDVKIQYGTNVTRLKGLSVPPQVITDLASFHHSNSSIVQPKIVWGSTTVNVGSGVRTKNIPAFNHGGGFATSAVLALFHVDQTNLASGMLPLSVHTNALTLTQLGFDIYFYATDASPHASVTITWAVLGY